MVKWINLILIISLFISCNSVNLAKYKSKNEAKSSFAIEKNTTISETTLTKIKDYEKINFRLVEEKSSKQNTSEENNSILYSGYCSINCSIIEIYASLTIGNLLESYPK